jgi:hypothetical protein
VFGSEAAVLHLRASQTFAHHMRLAKFHASCTLGIFRFTMRVDNQAAACRRLSLVSLNGDFIHATVAIVVLEALRVRVVVPCVIVVSHYTI